MDHVATRAVGIKPILKIVDKVHSAFSRYDVRFTGTTDSNPEPMVNASHYVDLLDSDIIGDIAAAMSRHQLWGFAKFAPQQSLFDSSRMSIGVVPYIGNGLLRKDLYSDDETIYQYKRIIAEFLKQAYDAQWRAYDYKDLAEQILDMERRILHISPPPEAWKRVHMTLEGFTELGPELGIAKAISNRLDKDRKQHAPVAKIEVMFPEYWIKLRDVIRKTSKGAMRAYLIWQTFLQTQHLLDHDTANNYRSLIRKIGGTMEALGMSIFRNVKEQYIKLFNETPWMDSKSRERAIKKAENMRAMIGYSKVSPDLMSWVDIEKFYAGAKVHATLGSFIGTHANDYLEMEAWYTRGAWAKELYQAPNTAEWFMNAFDVDTYYSNQLNSMIIPAAAMMWPLMEPGLPSYINYGGLGALMAQKMAHAFDAQGRMFSSNGSLESWMTPGDVAEFDYRQRCFEAKYNRLDVMGNDGEVYRLDGEQVGDEVIADTYGHEMAYNAWKAQLENGEEQMLPGFDRFTDEQMFWVFRTWPYCSKRRDQLLPQQISTSINPPSGTESWAPLRDSKGWREAFGCKVKKQETPCQIWSKDDKYDKIGHDVVTGSGKRSKYEEDGKEEDDEDIEN
ncbi:hypothetical protein G7Z17_g5286 [Cylindrodendrum hubeiense]|uniref:Uncharacterized protein n=1 Tax=Cylindrodendrum hubeiense TaxID=595255 RepID=A0A9P5HB57_9HYPO|nr:hypothetical protein G7Z17_g5286 [Cylindrodendrum hubeiense]